MKKLTVDNSIKSNNLLLKTKRQLGETWKLKNTFTGMKITWMRACVLMPTYFIWLDTFRRHFDTFFRTNLMGPFLGKFILNSIYAFLSNF